MSQFIVKLELLNEKLNKIDESLRKIASIKDGTKEKLEELKLSLRKMYDPNGMSKRLISVSCNILPCLKNITEATTFVDRHILEISCVQNRHDNLKHDLENFRIIIEKKIGSVQRCTWEINKLNSEILECTLINLQDLRELNIRKTQLKNVYDPNNVNLVLKYTEISKEIQEVKENYQSVLTSLQEQKKEVIQELNDSRFIVEEYKSVCEKEYYKELTNLIELSEDKTEINKLLKNICKYKSSNNFPNSLPIESYFQHFCDVIQSRCVAYVRKIIR